MKNEPPILRNGQVLKSEPEAAATDRSSTSEALVGGKEQSVATRLDVDSNSASTQNRSDTASANSSTAGAAARLLDHRPTVFLLLFCVMGFLGIPLLIKSSSFTVGEKVFWSVVVSIYTCLLIWGTLVILWWSYSQILQALS